MKYKWLIIIVFLLITGLAASYFYFTYFNKIKHIEPVKVVPKSAFLILRDQNNFQRASEIEENPIWKLFENNSPLAEKKQNYTDLKKFMDSMNTKWQLFDEAVISLHVTSQDRVDLLLLFNNSNVKEGDYTSALKKAFSSLRYNAHQFANIKVINIIKEDEQIGAFSLYEDLAIFSTSPLLIEDVIRGIDEPADEPGEEIIINYSNLKDLFELPIKTSDKSIFSKLKNLKAKGTYDLSLSDNHIRLNGNFAFENEAWKYLELSNNLNPLESNIENYLPKRTAFYYTYTISDPGIYADNLVNFYQKQGSIRNKNIIDSMNSQYSIKSWQDAEKLIPMETAYVLNETMDSDISDNAYHVFLFREEDNIDPSLKELSELSMKDSAQFAFEPISYRGIEISKINYGNLLQWLFPLYELRDDNLWSMIQGNAYFVSNSPETLKHIIDDTESRELLGSSTNYLALENEMPSLYNVLMYLNPSRALSIPTPYLPEKKLEDYRKLVPAFNTTNAIAIEWTQSGDHYFNNIAINLKEKERNLNEKLWEFVCDTSINVGPFPVTNHNNGQTEFIFQDAAQDLYLMDRTGKILFKAPIKGKILGEVHQVDLYKNDKLQYAFATENFLYVIDRLGRKVANYPIRLSTKANSGLAVFDYFDNKNYQFYVACDNGKIFGYESGGRPLRAWSPQLADAPLAFPLKYLVFKSKVYILGLSQNGTFYIWDKNGNRILKSETGSQFKSDLEAYFGDDESSTYITSLDTSGTQHLFYLDGEHEEKTISKAALTSTRYLKGNFSDATGMEYIYIHPRSLEVYSQWAESIFSYNTIDSITWFKEPVKVNGVTALPYTSNEMIHAMNALGRDVSGFPIKGRSLHYNGDINRDSYEEVLILQDSKRIQLIQLH